jgi:hypothetical protein
LIDDGDADDGGPSLIDADADADADVPDPVVIFEITSITPDEAEFATPVDIVIIGQGFDASTTANIGGLAVAGVSVINGETLTGRSPSALPEGTHDVEVIRSIPGGTESTVLPESFMVFDDASDETDDDLDADGDDADGDDADGDDADGDDADGADAEDDRDENVNAEETDRESTPERSEKGGCSHMGGSAPGHLAWLGMLILVARRKN